MGLQMKPTPPQHRIPLSHQQAKQNIHAGNSIPRQTRNTATIPSKRSNKISPLQETSRTSLHLPAPAATNSCIPMAFPPLDAPRRPTWPPPAATTAPCRQRGCRVQYTAQGTFITVTAEVKNQTNADTQRSAMGPTFAESLEKRERGAGEGRCLRRPMLHGSGGEIVSSGQWGSLGGEEWWTREN